MPKFDLDKTYRMVTIISGVGDALYLFADEDALVIIGAFIALTFSFAAICFKIACLKGNLKDQNESIKHYNALLKLQASASAVHKEKELSRPFRTYLLHTSNAIFSFILSAIIAGLKLGAVDASSDSNLKGPWPFFTMTLGRVVIFLILELIIPDYGKTLTLQLQRDYDELEAAYFLNEVIEDLNTDKARLREQILIESNSPGSGQKVIPIIKASINNALILATLKQSHRANQLVNEIRAR